MSTYDPYFEKGLPSCQDAERSILGSVLLDNDRFDELDSLLPPQAMFIDSHRRIYKAFKKIRDDDQPIDLVTICDELRRTGEFEQIGGATYIASLIDGVPRTDTIAPYVKLVRAAWHKRKLLNVSANIQAMVFDDEIDADKMQAAAEQYIYELAEGEAGTDGPKHVATTAAKLVDFYEAKAHDRSALIGLSTGFREINERTLGLTTGVTVIGARSSHGKTALATNIGTNAAIAGKSVYFASIESGAEKIVQRILASMSSIDSYHMRRGRMNPDEWQRLEQSLERLAITQFVVDDTTDLTPDMLISRCRQHKTRFGLDLVIVDYIQEMESGKHYRNQQERVAQVMAGLRRVTRTLDVPVLALSQLRREVDERPNQRPNQSDLADAPSAILAVADTIILLSRKWIYTREEIDKGIALLILAKNRDGSTDDDIYMAFTDQYTRFGDLAWDDWPKEEKRGSRRRQRTNYHYYGSRTDNDGDG